MSLNIKSEKGTIQEKREDYISHMRKRQASYKRLWQRNRYIHSFLQLIIIAGAAIVPALLSIPLVPKEFPIIISCLVAVAAAASNLYKFGDRSRNGHTTDRSMRREIDCYETRSGPYKSLDEDQAFNLFVERIESVLDEHLKNVLVIDQNQRINEK